jgi:hypothetical protein
MACQSIPFSPSLILRSRQAMLFKSKRTLARSDEFPAVIDAIRDKLKSCGLIEEADRLHTLVHKMAWTTSSEIYGELSLALKEVQTECRELSPEIAGESDRVLKSIERICRGR